MKKLILFLASLMLYLSSVSSQVLITEFLADPKDPIETEWIELFNNSDQGIDLENWQLCDLVRCGKFGAHRLDPQSYLIISQDLSAFYLAYPDFDGVAIEISGWRQLNNSGDMILLTNEENRTIDSVIYASGNGGNISWERLYFDRAGWDAGNWYRSLDQTGSTPGKRNSVAGGFPSDFTISLPDKLFSPGCECPFAYLTYDISIPRDCGFTLIVYSVDGRKLKVIYDNESLASGEYTYDGRDSNGHFLDTGMYILFAEVSGDLSSVQKIVFGVAKR